jgi:hypothetical protein
VTIEDVTVVEDYLHDLGSGLRGPRRVKAGLLREAAGHLEDATDAYVAGGLGRAEAESRAVADFGRVDEVAPAFQTTLAVAASRRTAWTFLAVIVPQGFIWDSGLRLSSRVHAESPDTLLFATLDATVELLGGLVIVAMLLAIVATGIGNRWFHAGRGIARATAVGTLIAAPAVPLTGIAMLVLSSGGGPTLVALAVLLLVAPMAVAAASARRCLRAAG